MSDRLDPTTLHRRDRIVGTFQPVENPAGLKPEVVRSIGWRGKWLAGWEVEVEVDPWHLGQWVMIPISVEYLGFTFALSCDIVDAGPEKRVSSSPQLVRSAAG